MNEIKRFHCNCLEFDWFTWNELTCHSKLNDGKFIEFMQLILFCYFPPKFVEHRVSHWHLWSPWTRYSWRTLHRLFPIWQLTYSLLFKLRHFTNARDRMRLRLRKSNARASIFMKIVTSTQIKRTIIYWFQCESFLLRSDAFEGYFSKTCRIGIEPKICPKIWHQPVLRMCVVQTTSVELLFSVLDRQLPFTWIIEPSRRRYWGFQLFPFIEPTTMTTHTHTKTK